MFAVLKKKELCLKSHDSYYGDISASFITIKL